mmetsp:Transcript_21572/g.35606  ORF Transcript_21572/g.35606 Transcript_21572/m.35606 type:complete len:457 (+) Transcript_21572:39-1409(+)
MWSTSLPTVRDPTQDSTRDYARDHAREQCVTEVRLAIRLGVPLFNAGYVGECNDIYTRCATRLLNLDLPEGPERVLRNAIKNANGEIHNHARRAWILRNALDNLAALSKKKVLVQQDMHFSRLPKIAYIAAAIPSLPEDLSPNVLQNLCATDLGAASCVCTAWRRDALLVAKGLLCARRSLPAGDPPNWIRALTSEEILEAAVGRRPLQRPWWREWEAMKMEEIQLSGQDPRHANLAFFQPGGPMSVAAVLRHNAVRLSWMLDCGWPLTQAAACLLIGIHGTAALGTAIREGSSRFAASTYAYSDALFSRAWKLKAAVPPCYASMGGMFGLVATDEAWRLLLSADVRIGFQLRTNSALIAMDNHLDEQGPIAPPSHMTRSVSTPVRHVSNDPLVCFRSELTRDGKLRSLVQTSPTCYELPPLATLTLERIQQPGQWQACGGTMWRKCFVVSMCMPY